MIALSPAEKKKILKMIIPWEGETAVRRNEKLQSKTYLNINILLN